MPTDGLSGSTAGFALAALVLSTMRSLWSGLERMGFMNRTWPVSSLGATAADSDSQRVRGKGDSSCCVPCPMVALDLLMVTK